VTAWGKNEGMGSHSLWRLGLLTTVVLRCQPALGQDCGCDVSSDRQEAYDEQLTLPPAEARTAEARHAPLGRPKGLGSDVSEKVLVQETFITGYSPALRVPVWASYLLRAEELKSRHRTECFRRDVRLDEPDSSFCQDYREPVFDRGHLVPSADMTRSESAMVNTYVLSNIVPQFNRFNGGIWAHLEERVRKWTGKHGELLIVTGPIFDRDQDGRPDAMRMAYAMAPRFRVAIPTHFYKVLVRKDADGTRHSLAFVLPHDSQPISGRRQQDAYLANHLRSIDDIEVLTGYDFFPNLSATASEDIEGPPASSLWP
jgi:endonuclease G, mitochondrial